MNHSEGNEDGTHTHRSFPLESFPWDGHGAKHCGSSLFYSQSPKWQVCDHPVLQLKELRLTEGRNLPVATQYIRSRAGISAEVPVTPATVCTVDKQKCLKPS